MKNNTGMSRKVDELGRIVIPKEIRNKFDIKTNDRLDIYVENGVISLIKDDKKCIFCSSTKDLTEHNNKHICNKCMQKLVKKFMII
ncbi:MAG: AbrB/MazE/SpoVT family DNA-binding domain-containing protein [Clostridia bacterium]|nr:AbrB/MazE/SpoVT family DNA-binding domain-containing protein [Clostridia bacterium]